MRNNVQKFPRTSRAQRWHCSPLSASLLLDIWRGLLYMTSTFKGLKAIKLMIELYVDRGRKGKYLNTWWMLSKVVIGRRNSTFTWSRRREAKNRIIQIPRGRRDRRRTEKEGLTILSLFMPHRVSDSSLHGRHSCGNAQISVEWYGFWKALNAWPDAWIWKDSGNSS